MSKKSHTCGYTGHMHTMNKKNITKTSYDSAQAHQHESQQLNKQSLGHQTSYQCPCIQKDER
jgi:hypothetical protein